MKECIYSKQYGGKWHKIFCCHVWKKQGEYEHDRLIIEKSICIDCGREEKK